MSKMIFDIPLKVDIRDLSSGIERAEYGEYGVLQDVDIFAYPDLIKAFRSFLKLEFATENLDFLEALHQLKDEILTNAEWKNKWEHIYETYIREASPKQINISIDLRNKIIQALSLDDEEMDLFMQEIQDSFQAAAIAVNNIVKSDSWRQFKSTGPCHSLLPLIRVKVMQAEVDKAEEAVLEARKEVEKVELRAMAELEKVKEVELRKQEIALSMSEGLIAGINAINTASTIEEKLQREEVQRDMQATMDKARQGVFEARSQIKKVALKVAEEVEKAKENEREKLQKLHATVEALMAAKEEIDVLIPVEEKQSVHKPSMLWQWWERLVQMTKPATKVEPTSTPQLLDKAANAPRLERRGASRALLEKLAQEKVPVKKQETQESLDTEERPERKDDKLAETVKRKGPWSRY